MIEFFKGDAEWDDYGDGYWSRGGPGPVGRAKPPLRGGGGGGGGGGYEDEEYMDGPRHFVHMRGLPYKAIEDDIALVKKLRSERENSALLLLIFIRRFSFSDL